MDSSANEDFQICIEYIGDAQRPLPEHPTAPDLWQDGGHLSPGWPYRSAASDSGSDCQSSASSPFSSPLLGPYDGFPHQSSSPVAGLDDIAHLSLGASGFYTNPEALLSSTSLYSDSDVSSLLSAGDPFFNYPSSPSPSSSYFASGHSQCPSPQDILPPSYPLSASPTIPVPDDLFLTSGPFDYGYSLSSPSHNIGSPLPKSEPSEPIGIPEVTEFISEASDGQSHLDPANIRTQLLHTLSPTSGDVKTLFSKNPKNCVSTPAGRAASELRRKHPARFACQFTGCDATFTRKLGLENHHKSHLGITDQQCRYCSKRFPNSLPRHMKRCKDNPARIATKKSKK